MIKNLLVSSGEKGTSRFLDDLFLSTKYSVSRKVRLADIFDVAGKLWTQEEKNFIFKAHFDFIISESEGMMKPLFAIEFDGEYHHNSQQVKRDRLKNRICQKVNFPICRFRNEDIQFKNGIQPALDKLFNIASITPQIIKGFVEKLNKIQRLIIKDYSEWRLYKCPSDVLFLPNLSELMSRLTLSRSAIYILNSLKFSTFYAIGRHTCKEKKLALTTKNIVDTTVEKIAESNDIDLQQFTIAILFEELIKKKPVDITIQDYCRNLFPEDPEYHIDSFEKFLVNN